MSRTASSRGDMIDDHSRVRVRIIGGRIRRRRRDRFNHGIFQTQVEQTVFCAHIIELRYRARCERERLGGVETRRRIKQVPNIEKGMVIETGPGPARRVRVRRQYLAEIPADTPRCPAGIERGVVCSITGENYGRHAVDAIHVRRIASAAAIAINGCRGG